MSAHILAYGPNSGCSLTKLRAVEILVTGTFNGKPVEVLVDSGAGISIVHKSLLNAPQLGCLVDSPVELGGINGDAEPAAGVVPAKLSIGALEMSHPFVVSNKSPFKVVLGADLLSEHSFVIDLKKRRLYSSVDDVPIQCRIYSHPEVEVLTANTVRIPAKTEVIVPATLPAKKFGLQKQGLVEASTELEHKHGIAVARTIVTPSPSEYFPVRLYNRLDKDLVLKRATVIGKYSEVRDLEHYSGAGKIHVASAMLAQDSGPTDWLDEIKIGEELTNDQYEVVETLLRKYHMVFSKNKSDIGRNDWLYHRIQTNDARPVKQAVRRLTPEKQKIVEEHLKEMLDLKQIRPSQSPWSSPVVLVTKKCGSTRLCIDYRQLNAVTVKDAYPLPRCDAVLDLLAGSQYFSTLDLASGFHQIEVHPADRHKTGFCTHKGLYEFLVLPYGLCNSPSTFQRLVDLVLAGLTWKSCLIYVDDICVFAPDFPTHVKRLVEVFECLKSAGLKLKASKCKLFQKEALYLGFLITANGVFPDKNKMDCVKNWPTPKSVKEIKSFLGLVR